MIGYKLFRKRKDGSYGPLFINRKQKIELNITYLAEEHLTKGFAFRPGWHICKRPIAPHLSLEGRVWCKVEFDLKQVLSRPEHQGGIWYLGNSMRLIKEM